MFAPNLPISLTKMLAKDIQTAIAFDALILWGAINRDEIFAQAKSNDIQLKFLLADKIQRLEKMGLKGEIP